MARRVRLLNYTGHSLTLLEGGGFASTFRSEGRVRIANKREKREDLEVQVSNGFMLMPLLELTEDKVLGLPDPQPDTLYIVSGVVQAAIGRPDLVVPGSTLRLEDGTGRVVGARSLVRVIRKEQR